MKAITYYEVYVVKLGHWTLLARHGEGEKDRALEMARSVEAESGRSTQVLEETVELEPEQLTVCVVAKNGYAPQDTKGPSTGSDLISRIFVVGVNALGISAIVTIAMAVALSSLGGPAAEMFGALMLAVFVATALLAGLLLVKVYIPIEWILWRGKSPEAQRRAVDALLYGTPGVQSRAAAGTDDDEIDGAVTATPEAQTEPQADTAQEPPHERPSQPMEWSTTNTAPIAASPAPTPAPPPASAPPVQRQETNADQGEQTSFQIGAGPATASAQPSESVAAEPESILEGAAALTESLLEKESAALLEFADACVGALMATRPQLQSFERVGLNLYLAGAAAALVERAGFADSFKPDLLRKALEHTGTNALVADAFAQRLDVSAQKPRYRQLIDAGHAAMTAQLDGSSGTDVPALSNLVQQWADPNARSAEVRKVTFLLTDIVGSTAMTSKLGNAGAQRVVRAHNAAVRAAVKSFRGTEVKHTGDGLLLTFIDAAAACRAAIEIQDDCAAYSRDNPEAPLLLRLGVHYGEASFEEGEYYGPALAVLNGVCSAAGEGQVYCSEEAKSRCMGPAFRFQDMGKHKLKGGQAEVPVFKLEWSPKIKPVTGPLEYGQIGRKANTADSA